MNVQLLFRITGAALGIQLALGGLVTFNFIDTSPHIVWGVVLFLLALATLAFVIRMPGRPKPLVGLAAGIVVDIALQALLGFAVLGTSGNANLSSGIAWVHFLNSLAIFAMTLMATGMVMAAARMQGGPPAPPPAQPGA